MSTPAVASVRRSWPSAHITMVCSDYNAIVMDRNPDIDDLISAAPDARVEDIGVRLQPSVDLAIALAPRAPDFALVRATNARRRIGYTYVRRYVARLTARYYLTDSLVSEADPELSERDPERLVRHEVDCVLDLVRRAGGREIVRDLIVPIEDGDRDAVANVPSGAITVHLAPRWFHTGSTFDTVVALLADLRVLRLPIVVTYGPDVADEAAALGLLGCADAIVGGMDFYGWAAIFEKSRVVVTVDTGATHVASAARRPTVVLFEDRYFSLCHREWAPYRVPAVCLRKPKDVDPDSQRLLRRNVVAAVVSLL